MGIKAVERVTPAEGERVLVARRAQSCLDQFRQGFERFGVLAVLIVHVGEILEYHQDVVVFTISLPSGDLQRLFIELLGRVIPSEVFAHLCRLDHRL